MKVAGIIAEYNPFHTGHQYQLLETRNRTQADFVIIVMSGNFVQRGGPAFLDKYTRARMALASGADLVLELPAAFASGSAEDFSRGAVSLLHKLHAVDVLSFGSECGDLALLDRCADSLGDESPAFRSALLQSLKSGDTFPAARAKAMEAVGLPAALVKAAATPNNLLGIEYLRAIRYFGVRDSLKAVTVTRKGAGYHEPFSAEGSGPLSDLDFASASGIRDQLQKLSAAPQPLFLEALPPSIRQAIPETAAQVWQCQPQLPLFPDDCSDLLNYRIALAVSDLRQEHVCGISDFSEELANRLFQRAFSPETFTERITSLKTRQYTYTRVSRALTHLLLNVQAPDMERIRAQGYAAYGRVLGFRRSAAPLLAALKASSEIPLITKPAAQTRGFSGSAAALWALDLRAANIYETLVQQKYHTPSSPYNEYSRPLIIL